MFNKRSYLVLISVFVLIFSLTCVSAAQDNITADEKVSNEYVAIDDISQGDLISKSSDEKVVSEGSIEDVIPGEDDEFFFDSNPGKKQKFGNVTLYIDDESSTNEYAHYPLAKVYDSTIDGQISLSIDNKEYYNKVYNRDDYYSSISIWSQWFNLPDNLKVGVHNVTLSYLKNGESTPYTFKNTVIFEYYPTITQTYGYDSVNFKIYSAVGNGNFTVREFIEEPGSSHSPEYKGKFISSGIISNGRGEITLSNLTRQDHDFMFYMLIDGQNYEISGYVNTFKFKESEDSNESSISDGAGKTNSNPTTNQKQNSKTKKLATKITANKATFKAKKKTKIYSITLKTGKKAVKKVKVYLKIGKKLFKATTNNKGKATFKITKLAKKGTYKSKITFKGNKYYKATSKNLIIKIR